MNLSPSFSRNPSSSSRQSHSCVHSFYSLIGFDFFVFSLVLRCCSFIRTFRSLSSYFSCASSPSLSNSLSFSVCIFSFSSSRLLPIYRSISSSQSFSPSLCVTLAPSRSSLLLILLTLSKFLFHILGYKRFPISLFSVGFLHSETYSHTIGFGRKKETERES